MLPVFLKKIKNMALTLRVSILTIFVILFVTAMVSLIAIFYVNSSNSLTYASNQLINEVSSAVFQNIARELQQDVVEAQMAARLFNRDVVDSHHTAQVSEFVVHTMAREMQSFSSIHSVYWSDETGAVILARQAPDGTVASEIVEQTPAGIQRTIISRDKDMNVTHTEKLTTTYDPRVRPWYMNVKKTEQTGITDVYRYTFFQRPFWGLTIAAPVMNKTNGKFIGEFGINVRLDFLRRLVEKVNISEHGIIFIVAKNGDVIAYPHLPQFKNDTLQTVDSLHNPIISEASQLYIQHPRSQYMFTVNGQRYLAAVKEIKFVTQPWFLVILAPEEDFIGTLKKTNVITVLVGIAILILGIVIFSALITRAVRSLKFLIKETEKIKQFELSEDVHIKSRIKEIDYLAHALDSMKKGLRSFKKYVPADLVRQLIESGMDVQVGGNKLPLVIFFSDIENFTTIAESLDPNQLVQHTCNYFDELSTIITQEKGTIDKYIGDAIMAFWGAPLVTADPCVHAAQAALACQQRLSLLNEQWQRQQLPPFITRIGIHFGEAIVGNLGSSERLNYTAIGDAINIASRLQGCNKLYHTHIMVSESVYDVIHQQFLLRFVDCVMLKGKEQAIRIYELLGEKSAVLPFDLSAYQNQFALGFAAYQEQQWDKAMNYFQQCLHIYPKDRVASIFIARCQQFKLNPPQHWSGVWFIQEK